MDVFQYSERPDVGLSAKDVIHDHTLLYPASAWTSV